VHHTSRLGRVVAASLVASVSFAALAGGAVALAGAAHAAFVDVPATGQPGRLVLSSDPYPAEFLDLSPGDVGYWQIGARLEDAARATLSLQLRKDGELVRHPRGLTMTVDICAVAWTGMDAVPACPTGAQSVTVATPADDYATSSPTFDLQPLVAGAPQFLLVSLAVEDSPAASADTTLMGLTGDMGVGLTAMSIDGAPVPPNATGTLPATGATWPMLGAVAALALGMLGLGAALRISRKGAMR